LKREQEEARKREAEAKKKQEQQEAKKRAEEKEKAKQQELFQKRSESITKIAIALDSEFPLTDSELSSQYQNWKEQINQLTDIQKIANLQDRLLADIQARQKDKKSAQEVKENLNKTQTGTEEEKKQAWENFMRLAPSHRRNYVLWISTAKREETRAKRLQEAIRLLIQDKKLGLK